MPYSIQCVIKDLDSGSICHIVYSVIKDLDSGSICHIVYSGAS